MRPIFNFITVTALRFWYVTLGLIVVLLGAGIVAATELNQELLPPVSFPQTVILAQVSGMTSEQALTVLTERLEAEIIQLPDIVNVESTTNSALGGLITAYNDFGVDSERLIRDIQAAVDRVWLPQRRIEPDEGQDVQAFARELLADLTPDVLIYLARRDANFLFQLSPDIWALLPDETVTTVLAYLADQVEEVQENKSALVRLVEQQIVPQITALDQIASVQVSGGQALPGDETPITVSLDDLPPARSLLFQLGPDVWAVVREKVPGLDALDDSAVATLRAIPYEIPRVAPRLPESWQRDHFEDAGDLLESRTLTTNLAGLFNRFYDTGRIVAALGQTNDLTPETVTRLLEIEPSLVNYFEAEHLVAMPPEVFAILPEDFIANLDGFTRDALAAARLAESITGEATQVAPVNLPSAWRIQPPQILRFSFADLPLASYSIFTTDATPLLQQASAAGQPVDVSNQPDTASTPADASATAADDNVPATTPQIPEGPALPQTLTLIGAALGLQLNTADDLINAQLPANLAEQFGSDTLNAADLFNLLALFSNPDALPPGVPVPPIPLNPNAIIGALSPDVIAFLDEYDAGFIRSLSPDVYEFFSDAVLALPQVSPPLSDVWNALASQPQFADRPLRTAGDVIAIGEGSASAVLNAINEGIPARFAGYEVRLFNSLTPAVMRDFALAEPGFYANLSPDVYRKLSPVALQALPQAVLAQLPADLSGDLLAIARGERNSAFDDLRELYATDVPPADPDAPALNDDWVFIGNFIGVELDSADDFFRFYPGAEADFLNSFFDTAQGISFAPNLFGNMTLEMFEYMARRDPNLLGELRIEILQLLRPEVLAGLPAEIQARAQEGGEPFRPTALVTRQNGASSLLLTVFKTQEANTVEAHYAALDVIRQIEAENPGLNFSIAFEQASFIEESITGVAREGTTGAIFAMIIILLFLSGGVWAKARRRSAGTVLVAVFIGALALVTVSAAQANGGDLATAFNEMDIVLRVLLIGGVIASLVILAYPANLPIPAWRATLVIGVSIPLSILSAFTLMRWFVPAMNGLIAPLAEDSAFFTFLLQLFPAQLTLNIMTLSGLTVAVGRIVDDSIVVLENSFRYLQAGGDRREAIIRGVRDVSSAIFTATTIAVVVFLPLGLTGGLIGEFFLPFGLAVTYSLLSSFFVAITVIPVLMYLFVSSKDAPEDGDIWLARYYRPVLRLALRNNTTRFTVIGLAVLSMGVSGILFGSRPAAFLPEFGEVQIQASVRLPVGTRIIETDALVREFEAYVTELIPANELETVQVVVGGGGLDIEAFFTGGSVSENRANVTIGLRTTPDNLERYTESLKARADEIFGTDFVSVDQATLASGGGFGGFDLVVSGPIELLTAYNDRIIAAIESVDGITNVTSNLADDDDTGAAQSVTYLRVNQQSALSYRGELTTENTIGVSALAIEAIRAIPDLPDELTVSQGFNSEIQTQGFFSLFIAMGLSIVIVVSILLAYLRSPVYWMAILGSVLVAPFGAAVALTLTDRVLGISALIGLLMLIGLVITNAVVLIDRVRQNMFENGLPLYDALIEAGGRRLRPILMTSLATIIALIPLAAGLSGGGLIAEELGTVVIGGVFSSTILTLVVVPVAYSLLTPLHNAILRRRQPSA